MEATDALCISELPCGLPPIFSEIENELQEYIECLDRLPIHQMENVQAYYPRETKILDLVDYDLAPLGTTLKFDRDPITGRLSNMREDVLQGAGETARNSMSMSRARGPQSDGIKGNSSNFPFWPGGFDEPGINKSFSNASLDFENNLRTLAKGFSSGVEFKKDNYTPVVSATCNQKNSKKKKRTLSINMEKVNLMAIVRDEENQLGLWSDGSKDVENQNSTPPIKVDSDLPTLEDMKDVPLDSTDAPIIRITNTAPLPKTRAEWAEQLDVSVPVADFDKKVPKPAMTFDYELDTFQKQAIMKLEEGCSVFVAAHTSAGKTTVAEYAIALSQRHMTRIIYTSPIKALSNQKYRDFKRNKAFDSIGLITGDVQINQTASCLIMTTEILLTMLYNASEVLRDLEYVIFDEVHYINDADRGHVWEEIVILLPATVSIVMLSATVPNPLIFANWVGRIKQRKMYVISTLKRPVPLEHYLYLGTDRKSKPHQMLVLDAEGNFLLHNWHAAQKMKDDLGPDEGKSKQGKGGPIVKTRHQKKLTPKQEKTMWEAFIYHLKQKEKMPVVIFTLSRFRCDANADALIHIDLTSAKEKSHVRSFFRRCVQRLNEPDRELPQIKRMERLLINGIGIHHSGILPILKEIIELLFQSGIVKLLFATETFAMGINMPARTVVFDSVTKYDGKNFRGLLPTEYIQMAGRAGRRGHDETGTVIIMCKTEVPHFMILKTMMLGQTENFQSQFKITYAMVLNLRRVSESVTVEDMMRKSFMEMKLASGEQAYRDSLKRISEELAAMPPLDDDQKEMKEFFDVASTYLSEKRAITDHLMSRDNTLKMMTLGRVLKISYRHHYCKLGLLVGTVVKNQSKEYLVLILNDNKNEREIHDEWREDNEEGNMWYDMIALTKNGIYVPRCSGFPDSELLSISSVHITNITSRVIKVDCGLIIRDFEKRKIDRFVNDPPSRTCQQAIEELLALSLTAEQVPATLMPFYVPFVEDVRLLVQASKVISMGQSLPNYKCIQVPDFEERFAHVFARGQLERKRSDLQLKLSAEGLSLYPEYVHRVNILHELGYIDTDDRVTLKGRVALDMGIHELLITELVYRNTLTNLQPAEIAATLSAMVYQQGSNNANENELPKHPVLGKTCEVMETVRREIMSTEQKFGVDPIEQLNYGLVEVVYEWARAEPFAKIMELTTVQEGIIVRCIQRLSEILRDVKTAAMRIGETVLQTKMEEALTAIKRDIVFTASLYTQD